MGGAWRVTWFSLRTPVSKAHEHALTLPGSLPPETVAQIVEALFMHAFVGEDAQRDYATGATMNPYPAHIGPLAITCGNSQMLLDARRDPGEVVLEDPQEELEAESVVHAAENEQQTGEQTSDIPAVDAEK